MPDSHAMSFGAQAELYDEVRLSYPPELVADLVGLVEPVCSPKVLEVGCGTGKATVLLGAHGLGGIAIEPDPRMAAVARRRLLPYPGWRVDEGTFERWEPEPADGPFDLIVAVESWHWVDRRVGPRKADALLRPGGWLAFFSYNDIREPTALQDELDALHARYQIGLDASDFAKARPFLRQGTSFAHAHLEGRYDVERDYTPTEWCDILRTNSVHLLMEPGALEDLLTEVAATIERHGGVYHHTTSCKLWAVQKRGSSRTGEEAPVLAPPAGLEPATHGLGNRRSIL
jgi:SAM-dependent methyltransferase